MSLIDTYLDEIDSNRLRRARELSQIKTILATENSDCFFAVKAKAVIVLAYSHWEGFYNECIATYIRYLRESKLVVKDTEWNMLAGTLTSELYSLRDRNHSTEAISDFVESLGNLLPMKYDKFDSGVLKAKSNLNFDRLKATYRILNFKLDPFQRKRIWINKELVGWRHSVAHGDNPDLTTADSQAHINSTQETLLVLADQFQDEITSRFT